MELRDIIKTYRKNHGMTQQEFAAASGISLGTVCAIEQQHRNPRTGEIMKTSSDVLIRVAKITGYSYNELSGIINKGDTIQTIEDSPLDGVAISRTEKDFCLRVRRLPIDVRTWLYKSVGIVPDPAEDIISAIPD